MAMLEGDVETDEEGDMPDDFVAMLGGVVEEPTPAAEEGGDDFDLEAHMARLIAQAELEDADRFGSDGEFDDDEYAQLAKAADVAIIVLGTSSSEGSDRLNLSFPAVSDALVDAVVDAQPNSVVVTFSPGAVLLPWSPKVKAILSMLMPGLEAGHAMTDLLWGAVNPSGRLPLTWPNTENEVGFTSRQYPGVNSTVSYYSELPQ